MATTEAPARPRRAARAEHGLRIFLIWLPVALAAD